jgi:hypothetical protein
MYNKKKPKTKISKYDIIKVKVHLNEHFFVFSRYLLANTLRVIKVIFFNEDSKQRCSKYQF